MAISFNTNQQAIVDSSYKTIDWLFEVTTSAGPKYFWSTKGDVDETTINSALSGAWATGISWGTGISWWSNTDVYSFKVIPESFNGITLNRSRSEYGIVAPSELSFSVGNADSSLTGSDFIDAVLIVRLIVGDGSSEEILRTFKFNRLSCYNNIITEAVDLQ